MGNKRQETQHELDLPENLGFRLKQMRKARGMAIEDVADQLRLPKSAIEAVEADQYIGEKNTVYIRGHIRSYAKLMGLSDREVHAQMIAMGLIEPAQPTRPMTFNVSQLSSKDRRMRYVTYGIIAIFFILILLWKYLG